MTNFNKTDIKTLDFLVDETLKNEIVTADNLKGLYPPADLLAEFKRLIYIINEYEICDCNFEEDSEFIRKNAKTLNFKTDGGFKKIYADLKEKEERESIEFEKTKIEFELSKKNP